MINFFLGNKKGKIKKRLINACTYKKQKGIKLNRIPCQKLRIGI